MPRDTRAEILQVASELFIDRGFDATSLREIAERLDITKAAVYYHFPSKDQILEALMDPAFDLVEGLGDKLAAATNVQDWADALEWLLGRMQAHIDVFRLLQRNRLALDHLSDRFHDPDRHASVSDRLEKSAHVVAGGDLRLEIRMITALGALTAFDDLAPGLLATAPVEVLHDELLGVVHDILHLTGKSKRSA